VLLEKKDRGQDEKSRSRRFNPYVRQGKVELLTNARDRKKKKRKVEGISQKRGP